MAERVNLRRLAVDLTKAEGLREQVSVAQVTEVIGRLGERWRAMRDSDAERWPWSEIHAVINRAGLRSTHRPLGAARALRARAEKRSEG